MSVLSVHVTVEESANPSATLDTRCPCLADDFDIARSMFPLETVDRRRIEERVPA